MKAPLIAAFVVLAFPAVAGAGLVSVETREVPVRARSLSMIRDTPRFNLVGMQWGGSGTVAFRTRSLHGRWSAWRSAAVEGPIWTGASDRIDYRRRGKVSRLRVHFLWSRVEAIPMRTLSEAGSPPIVARAAWGANEAIKRAPPEYADRIAFAVVHHTAGGNGYTRAQSAAIVRAIQVYHVKTNGWNDIGYNFLVDRYGQVFEGRAGGIDRNVVGAHAQGFNTGSFGVALLGSYQGSPPSAAAEASLVRLLAWRLDVAHVDPLSTFNWISSGNPRFPRGVPVYLRAIVGHRDVGFTDCPGSAVYARFGPIVQGVARTGLPKLYAPRATGRLGGNITFAGRLSSALPWTVSILDSTGAPVASGSGTGSTVAWTWNSSAAPPGTYSYVIEAEGVRSARGSLGRRTGTSQLVSAVVAAPSALTPNGDGKDDTATVSFTLAASATVTASLTDATGAFVNTLLTESRPAGANSFVFDPRELVGGAYTIVLSASTSDGRVGGGSVAIAVNLLGSDLTASRLVFSPNGDGRLDTIEFRFSLTAPTESKLRVLKEGRYVATVLAGALAAGPQVITWNGQKRIGRLVDGRYEAELTVGGFSKRIAFASDSTAPRLRLRRLRPARLWVSEPADVVISVDGRRHVLHLARAGSFRVPGRRPRRTLRAHARDPAGNVGRPLVETRYRRARR